MIKKMIKVCDCSIRKSEIDNLKSAIFNPEKQKIVVSNGLTYWTNIDNSKP